MPKKFDLDPPQAGEYLGVSADTLKYWRHTKKGPQYRKLPNGKISYSRADLDAFIASCVVDPRAA
jgi:hypothetical protein